MKPPGIMVLVSPDVVGNLAVTAGDRYTATSLTTLTAFVVHLC
jgi:hypothetical protein